METYAVDFESSYAKGRDIKSLGVVPYLEHPDTHLYLVSIHGPVVSYSGPVEFAPWHAINGQHWVSHNAAFDCACYQVAQARSQIPLEFGPSEWDCTANLCVFLSAPRALDKALKALLNITISKATRDAMKEKQWNEMSAAFQAEVIVYAKVDAEMCHLLWTTYSAQWPETERALSRHTMAMCLNGIAVDVPRVESAILVLTQALFACEARIPWANEVNAKGEDIAMMSPLALKAQCVKVGIPPPITTADKSDLFEAWMAKYEDQADFVRAVKDYRSLNRTLAVLKKLRDQTCPDGRIRYSLKYMGAHTGRWSGDSGLNFHNFTKASFHFNAVFTRLPSAEGAVHSLDLRGCLIPGPGKKFIVADLAQIEPRVALWFVDDQVQLDLIRSGLDLYEAHARSKMGYKFAQSLKDYCDSPDCPTKDKNLRQFAKCRVLGLGFGLGFKKFVLIVMQWAGLSITAAEAKQIVSDFRASNPDIVRMWNLLDRAMRRHAAQQDGSPFIIELPSGRRLSYFNANGSDDLKAQEEMGGLFTYWYGGKLFENLVQATARDVLGGAILRIEAAGHSVVLHVHDECVCEVDMHVQPAEIEALMTAVPEWAAGLPIGCSAHECDRYEK